MRIPFRGSALSLIIVGVLGLSGCSGGESFDLSDPEGIACDSVQSATAKLDELARDDISPGKRNGLERDLGIDFDDRDALQAATAALKRRAKDCQASPNEEVNEAEPEETPTASEPSEPTTEEEPTIIAGKSNLVGWDELPDVAFDRIDQYSSEVGFTADDARTWASATLPSGKLADARVVLVFGLPDTTDSEARSLADVNKKTEVVRVTSCTSIAGRGCPENQVRVMLAPLSIGEDGTVIGLRRGAGIVLAGNFPLITYTM